MRVLFASFDAIGHIIPMIPLAQAFQARGDTVRWATGADGHRRLQDAGIEAVAAGVSAADRRARAARIREEAGSLTGDELTAFLAPRVSGRVSTPAMLGDLLPLTRTWAPDVIVHDALEYAGPIAAAAAGIPHVTHGYGAIHSPRFVEAIGDETRPLWEGLGLIEPPYGGMFEYLYLDIYPPSLQVDDIHHIGRRQLLQPATYREVTDNREDSMKFGGGAGLPLVYVTFGTERENQQLLAAALAGAARLQARVVVTAGRHDPETFGPQPKNVTIARYIPQSAVMRQCDVVVSHGGSGTMLAAFSHGIPQLCIPQLADAFLNATALAKAGAGLVLDQETADADAVEAAVQSLLDEPSYRAAATRIAAEIASMPLPAEVAAVVQQVVKAG